MSNHTLIEPDDSVLIVIDAQPAFLNKLPAEESRPLVERICWLIGVAHWLHIPLVVTGEDVPHLGGVAPEIARMLPGVLTLNKMVFNLADDPNILDTVERTARKTTVLVGLESDVCVAQSGLGLLERGYRVVEVADATGSPETAHAAGLQRMHDAGVVIVNSKNLYYEWLRTVERVRRFRTECAEMNVPEGLRL